MTQPALLTTLAGVLVFGALAAPAQGAAGDLDTAFADRAAATLDLPDLSGVEATAVRPDGRVVVVTEGVATTGRLTQNILVHQLLPDGSPDRSFSGDGVAEIDTGGHDEAGAVALQRDGRIVVAGMAGPSSSRNVTVFRLLADGGPDGVNGGLDTTFNRDGAAGADSGFDEYVGGLTVDAQGRPVVVATSEDRSMDGTADIVAYRFLATGGTDEMNKGLDPTFDTDGVAGLHAGAQDRARGIAMRPDGSMVVIGTSLLDTSSEALVGVLKPGGGPGPVNGALDQSFDTGGFARLRDGAGGAASAVAVLPDGRILVAGESGSPRGTGVDGVVWRLRAGGGDATVNGVLDRTFAGDGSANLTPGGTDRPRGVAIDRAGRTVVGSHGVASGGSDAVVTRLLADGTPDPSFGAAGTAVVDRTRLEQIDAFALAPDGSPVLGGIGDRTGPITPLLYRVMPVNPRVAAPPADSAPPVAGAGAVLAQRALPWSIAKPRARFGARTLVTARRLRGRRVRLSNANAFRVRVRVTRRGAKAVRVTVPARGVRTVGVRGRSLKVTAVDPGGAARRVPLR